VDVRKARVLIAYWIARHDDLPNGYGVTAYSLEDALELLHEAAIEVDPNQIEVWEDVADELERESAPDIGATDRRGVWSPNLNT